ncbi:MAG: methylated-DNA--[protein]-cysteine S-methyltransferase [Verrucomicrobiae bacterium]|nr:methylated-DNA--[protein]-cysteine S-methyltransferase [Verrucomicrobiae bacterium]
MKGTRTIQCYCLATPAGRVRVELSERGLCALRLPRGRARRCGKSPAVLDALLRRLQRDLRDYFEGKPVEFRYPLDLAGATPFQRAVWRALRRIPYGQTRSYAQIARAIGRPRAFRAVGAACGSNPLPLLIPCHRVVASNGGIGGFACGLRWKKYLLSLETAAAEEVAEVQPE